MKPPEETSVATSETTAARKMSASEESFASLHREGTGDHPSVEEDEEGEEGPPDHLPSSLSTPSHSDAEKSAGGRLRGRGPPPRGATHGAPSFLTGSAPSARRSHEQQAAVGAASVSSSADASSSNVDHDSLSYSNNSSHSQHLHHPAAQHFSGPPATSRFQLTESVVVEVPDEEPLDADAYHNCLNFVAEGRVFLRAALELLAERDRQAPVLGRNDPVVFKSGSLKKASHLMNGVWKPKYVEIRRGMFSYYENVSSTSKQSSQPQLLLQQHQQQQHHHHHQQQQLQFQYQQQQQQLLQPKDSHQHPHGDKGGAGTGAGGTGGDGFLGGGGAAASSASAALCELLRKDIPLEAATCTCRAVKFHEKARNLAPTGAIFELAAGGQKRLWMAKTRADRQLWMQTIINATVGGSVTRGDSYMDHNGVLLLPWGANASASSNDPRSPYYKNDLRKYRAAQSSLKGAKSKNDYSAGLKGLVDQPLRVPVKWVAKQQQDKSLGMSSSHNSSGGGGGGRGEAGDGGAAFREETVDMSLDQLWRDMQRDSVTINGELFRGDAGHGPERIVGALVRQILAVGVERGDSAAPGQPVKHHHRSDLQESQALAYARDVLLSGNRTRSGGDSYFCVSTLCQNPDLVVIVPNSSTEPEPITIDVREDETDIRVIEKSGWIKSRIKNQKEWRKMFFVLSEGTLSFYESALPRPHRLRGQIVVAESTLSVSKLDHDFVLKLSKEGSLKIERLLSFTSADRLLDWTFALECSTRMKSAVTSSAKKLNRRKLIKAVGGGGGGEAPLDAAKGDILSLAAQSTKEHAANLGLDEEIVENRLALFSKRAAASMVISIRACSEYKVCTLDPTGEEDIDTWATIRAHFLQSFRLGGGANGRIMRGEEIVQISVAQRARAQVSPDRLGGAEQDPTSPSRRGQSRRIFRRFSTSEEVEEILKTSSID